jgi:hypothetical protein
VCWLALHITHSSNGSSTLHVAGAPSRVVFNHVPTSLPGLAIVLAAIQLLASAM